MPFFCGKVCAEVLMCAVGYWLTNASPMVWRGQLRRCEKFGMERLAWALLGNFRENIYSGKTYCLAIKEAIMMLT
jgi:hypothetical protein